MKQSPERFTEEEINTMRKAIAQKEGIEEQNLYYDLGDENHFGILYPTEVFGIIRYTRKHKAFNISEYFHGANLAKE